MTNAPSGAGTESERIGLSLSAIQASMRCRIVSSASPQSRASATLPGSFGSQCQSSSDCDSGICLGNSSARGERRHANGCIVRNNFVIRCSENSTQQIRWVGWILYPVDVVVVECPD